MDAAFEAWYRGGIPPESVAQPKQNGITMVAALRHIPVPPEVKLNFSTADEIRASAVAVCQAVNAGRQAGWTRSQFQDYYSKHSGDGLGTMEPAFAPKVLHFRSVLGPQGEFSAGRVALQPNCEVNHGSSDYEIKTEVQRILHFLGVPTGWVKSGKLAPVCENRRP